MRPRTIRHSNMCDYQMCARSGNVLQILFCAVDFSQQKRAKPGHSLLARRATSEYPAFTLIILILLCTNWNVETCTFLFTKRGGARAQSCHRCSLKVLRIKSFNIIDLRKTLSFRKHLSPSRKRTATFSSRKTGRGTDQ